MQKVNVFALALIACACVVARADDKLPVGYFVDPISVSDDKPVNNHAKVLRDGKEYDAVEGHEVYAGDVIVTDSTGQMQIAFLDSSGVRLLESTEFRIDGSGGGKATATLSYGHASFAASPTAGEPHADTHVGFLNGDGISNLINLGIGDHASVSSGSLAKIDIIVTRDANGTTFTSNIAVLKGSATLTPQGANKVNLSYLTTNLLTINMPVAGVAGPTTFTQGNLTKDQIAALAAKSVSDTTLTVNKNGSVSIKTVIKNADGSIVIGKVTEVGGQATIDAFTTKNSNNKTIATWLETSSHITLSRVFDGFTLKSTIKKPTDSGNGTFKGPNGVTYKGTVSYNPTNGVITFTSTVAKDGTSTIYTFNPNGGSAPDNSVVTVTKSGVATQTDVSYNNKSGVQTTTTEQGVVVNGKFVGNPSTIVTSSKSIGTTPVPATTPDGHAIDQNLPPVTQ